MSAAATVTKSTGAAFAVRDGQEIALVEGLELFVDDSLRTGINGQAEIRFTDGTEVSLGEMSQVSLQDFAYNPAVPAENSFALHMMEGIVRTVSGEVVKLNPDGFTLSTPLGTAGIRGTTIVAQIFPTHVVFVVTDMASGHIVTVNSVFGGELTIYQPGMGAEITLTGQEGIQLIDSLPEDMRDALNTLLSNIDEQGRSSHNDFILLQGDIDFMAALGAMDLGRGVGLLSAENEDIIVELLQQLGVEQPEFFLEAFFTDGWPTINWQGSDADDTYLGQPNNHYHLEGFKGNDRLVVFNGNDTVYGGNGSADRIMKVTSLMETGTYLYGGMAELPSPTELDNDTITVRAPSLNDPALGIATDDPDVDNYWDSNTEWYNTEMTGGEIYGSAGTLSGYTGAGGQNALHLYGNMSGGAFYGKAATVENCSFTHGGNWITIFGDMAGGAIYGDAYNMIGGQAGGDTIQVKGTMSDGVIYGDAAVMQGNAAAGKNHFEIETMTGGTIFGGDGGNQFTITTMNAGTINSGNGNDTLSITACNGGTINLGAGTDSILLSVASGDISIDAGAGVRNEVIFDRCDAGTKMDATIKANGTHNSIMLGEANGDVTLDYSGSAAATTLLIMKATGDVKITGVSNAVNNTTINTLTAKGTVQFNGANNDSIEILNAAGTCSITPGNGHDTLKIQGMMPNVDATINLHGVDNPVHNFDWIELGAVTGTNGAYKLTVFGFSEMTSFKTNTSWGVPVEAINMSNSTWSVKFTDNNNNTLTINLSDYDGTNPVSQFGANVTANHHYFKSLNSTAIYLDKRVGLVEVQGSSGAGEESIYCSGSGNPGLDGKQDVLNLLSGFNLSNNDTIRLHDFDNGTNNGTWDKIYYDSNDWDAGPQYINDTTYTLTQGSNTLTFVLNGVTGDQTQTTNIFVDTSI